MPRGNLYTNRGERMMKRLSWTLGILAVGCVATAIAQPPGGHGGRGGPPGGRPPMPVIDVLDADHDHVISAEELKDSTSALLKLDKNNDGQLTEDEFGPRMGGPGGGRGPGGPPGGGRPGGGNMQRRRPGGQGGLRDQDGPPERGGRGPGGGGPRDGGPEDRGLDPDRMVDHAMEYDANKDGKLSRDELAKFAEDFASHHRGPPGGHPEEDNGPDGPHGAAPNDRPTRPE